MGGEEEAEACCELVEVLVAFQGGLDVGYGVCECEGYFLCGGAACFADVVAAYADCVPVWHVFAAVFESVCDQAH